MAVVKGNIPLRGDRAFVKFGKMVNYFPAILPSSPPFLPDTLLSFPGTSPLWSDTVRCARSWSHTEDLVITANTYTASCSKLHMLTHLILTPAL